MSERAKQVLKYFEEQKDFTAARVKAGIELYRKSSARIRVVDAGGQPIGGAVIEANQQTQDFKFGANTFMIDEMETAEKNEIYKKKFPELFNLGTIPFYWDDLELIEGQPRYAIGSPRLYRRPATDLCMDYCRRYGVEPKLHCLNYEHATPPWAIGRSRRELKDLLVKRFDEIAARYGKEIPMIEVTNETYIPSPRGTEFFTDDDFCLWSYEAAQRAFPASRLIINESNICWEAPNAHTSRNPYGMQVEKLLSQGAPLHGIGLQYHSFHSAAREAEVLARPDGRYSPMQLCAILDRLGQYNLPLQITEMTIPAYSSREEDEAIQAEILRQVYSIFFAHKNMEAVIYWNLPDGYAYKAEPGDMTAGQNMYYAGLIGFDMSEKPAFKVLKKLIRDEWMTRTQLVTDEEGYATLRGFHGEYGLTVRAHERTSVHAFHLGKNDLQNSATLVFA